MVKGASSCAFKLQHLDPHFFFVIQRELDGAVNLIPCGTLAAAVRYARANAEKGDTVLLAPACASFDQFQNFEQRGSTFKQLVAELS